MAKNHYVSQLIIKRFAPSVTTFDTQEKILIENRKAHKIFYKNDIYDNNIEKKLAFELEQPFAKLLDEKILNTNKIILTRKELYLLKQFLLLDSVRTYDPESFVQVLKSFKKNVQHYLDLHGDVLEEQVRKLPSIFDFDLEARGIQMRAMRLFLDCKSADELIVHPLATQELYCWARVNYDSYIGFWDSADDQEFILTSTGMVSEYEPSHAIFEGLDLSKFSYLLSQVKSAKEENLINYARLLSFNQIMYENFNIFNLSSSRCMVLIHPFFRLYNTFQGLMNGKQIKVEKPDIWPTCFENREIVFPPNNRYQHLLLGISEGDEFEYIPKKLTFWDTVYLNGIILSQTHEVIGFNDITKIVDSLSFVNLLNSFEDRELLYELTGLEALERWVDNMISDKYYYIFKHYKDLKLKCKENTIFLTEKFSDLKWRDIRKNKYVLEYLLSDEEKLRTMSNFKFMGTPDDVVAGIKRMLKELH